MKTAWEKYTDEKLNIVMDFGEAYKEYLGRSKTEREATIASIAIAEAHGFKNGETAKNLKAGDKVYFNNRDKGLCLFVIGERPLIEGMNVLGAHIDSPRIDLKQHPLYEDNGLALFDTHYYGGIKNYQWVARPLALHGIVCKKDGTSVEVKIGEDDNDPVVGISDLLPHLAADQMKKTGSAIVEGEDLNVLVGSIPVTGEDKKEPVKENVLKILKDKYDIEEDDFISAELEIVPADKVRDLGLDRSLIMGYGHDDRVCAYTSLMAILDVEKPQRTACCILVDKEEVGSNGSTGMHSRFFENAVAELMDKCGVYSELALRKLFTNSYMLSSDVSAGFDPNYPSVNEPKNTAYLGKGITFNKYTGARGKSGCNDANPEFIAKLRKIMDAKDVAWQTSELGKVNQGGGGTIAYILANLNMEVIDAGVPVQNMHAPSEVVSKVDVYEAYRAYKVFIEDME